MKKKGNHDQRLFKKIQAFFEICKIIKIENFVFNFEVFFDNIFNDNFEIDFNFFNIAE